jgi:DNA polymerase III subunit delta
VSPAVASLGGVFYLHGSDEFRKEEALRALLDRHLDPGTRDFNLDILRGSEVSPEQLASVLGTPPMMAEWRVVVLRETEALASAPKARDRLLEVVARPPEGLALILSCTVPQGSSARFYSDLTRGTKATEFRPIPDGDLPGWVMERARSAHGVEIDEAAARGLVAATGGGLGILAQEIEKLSTVVQPGAPITLSDVESAGIRLPKQDRWGWFDLVAERKTHEALEGLRTLLDHGESGVGLVVGLGTHFLRMGLAKTGGARALEAALTAGPGRGAPWLARKLGDQARRWRADELEHAVLGLLEVDRLLKASGFSDQHLLETWLIEQSIGRKAA